MKTTGTVTTHVHITREGQEPPDEGDEVVVRGELHIKTKGSELPREVRFGSRVYAMGMPLVAGWGLGCDKSRYAGKTFRAKTWAAAEKDAREFCGGQEENIHAALRRRAEALVNAEKEETDEK